MTPDETKAIPDWVMAALRYALSALGVILAERGLIEGAAWDNIVVAVLAAAPALWGIYRTQQRSRELVQAKLVVEQEVARTARIAAQLRDERDAKTKPA